MIPIKILKLIFKQCCSCKQWKIREKDYYKDKRKKDGFYNNCKKCHKKNTNKHYKKNKKYYNQKKKKWREDNKEHIKNYNKQNKDKQKQYHIENKEKINERKKTKEYKEKRNEYERERRKYDIQFKLRNIVSGRINKAIKKENSILIILNYSMEELKKHLELQFDENMSWENYGHGKNCWHIDHIIPDSKFQYQSENDEEFKVCWCLDNLRPLWCVDNLKKQNFLIDYNELNENLKNNEIIKMIYERNEKGTS